MTVPDIRVFFTGYVLSVFLCIIVIGSLWWQNRKRSPEIILWLADYFLQFAGLILITLRGILPDILTIVIANIFIIGGTIILYTGLGRYVGKESRQLHNYVMLAIFTLVHLYLTYVHPDLNLRVVNISIALIYICAQCSWLMLYRVAPHLRSITRPTGIVFAIFCFVSIIQIGVNLTIPKVNSFIVSGLFGIFAVFIYQISFIALSMALFLMVSRRLSIELEDELLQRKQEEKLIKLRLSLLEFAATHSLEEVLQHTLDEVENLVDSSIGFYHFVESDQKTISLQAWSTRTLKEFCKAQGKGLHYGIDQAGVWVDCVHERHAVIHNDYYSLPHRKGMPEGHAPVIRELVVPIMRGGLVVAILGIGNKTADYTQKDAETVSYLADVAWEITQRKQTEEALKRSEEQVRLLLNSTAEAIYGIDLDGNCTFANPSCLNMLGYSNMEQLLGNNMHRLIHHSYPDGTKMDVEDCRIFRAFRKGKGEHADDEVLWKADGKNFPVEYWSYPQIANGEITGAVVTFIDISERKQMESQREAALKALLKSEEKFKQLAEVFPETIFEADMKGYVTYANEHGLKHFGFTREDFAKGVNILDLISPEDRILALERIQSRIQGGNKKYLEYKAMKKDGSTFYALALSIPIIVDGSPIGIRGFILDITESKRAEEALKQNQVFLNTLLNSMPIPVFYKDGEGKYTGFNRAFETFFGATKEQLIGKSVFDINPPELAKIYHAKDNELFESGCEQHYETQVKNMLGVTRDVIFNKAVFTDSQGKISGLIGAMLDISERKQAENALRESEERIRAITNSANDAIIMIDNGGNISYWNPAAESILGYTGEEAIGRDLHELIAPQRFIPAHRAAFPEFQKTGKGNAVGKRLELAARRKDGSEIDVALSLSAVNIKGIWNAVGIVQDISELKRAEQMIRESEERYRFLADHTADHIWTMDMSMRYTYSSPAVTTILGYTIQELMAKPFDQFYTPESLLTAQKALMEELETDTDPNADPNRIRTLQSEHYHKNGNLVWLESSLTFIRDAEMKPVGILGVSRDITERKKAEEQIQHLATHDLLTDLPGLRLARDRMSSAINMARRYKKSVALMFVDLDGFKAVNDTLGHDAGDYVLRQVALRLLSCVRETDTVARLGGDEFLIIATEINAPENAEQIARKVVKLVSQPVIFKDQQAVVGTSIGIALFPDDGGDMDQLLKLADEAMYKVKNAGKNGFRFVNTPIK